MAADLAWPRLLQSERPGSTLGIALVVALCAGLLGIAADASPPALAQVLGILGYAGFVLGLALLVPWAMLVLSTPPPDTAAKAIRITAGLFLLVVATPLAFLGVVLAGEPDELLPRLLPLNLTLLAMASILLVSSAHRKRRTAPNGKAAPMAT